MSALVRFHGVRYFYLFKLALYFKGIFSPFSSFQCKFWLLQRDTILFIVPGDGWCFMRENPTEGVVSNIKGREIISLCQLWGNAKAQNNTKLIVTVKGCNTYMFFHFDIVPSYSPNLYDVQKNVNSNAER